jgi:hypothetical protein
MFWKLKVLANDVEDVLHAKYPLTVYVPLYINMSTSSLDLRPGEARRTTYEARIVVVACDVERMVFHPESG